MTENKADPLREALEAARSEIVVAIAFLSRDTGTDRSVDTVRGIIDRLARADAAASAALAAQPAAPLGGRDEIARIIFGKACGLSRWDDAFYAEERHGCLETADAILAIPQERGVDRAARCTCGIMCQDLGKDAGCRYLKPEREALRKLVDVVYQHATESMIFPATVTADLLIDRVFGTGEITDSRGTILECADVARHIGARMNDTKTDFGAAKEIEVAIRALGKETGR